ncbi:hypothetical protein HDV64DRAFT_248994 [Trichoderma sp. TUCIM 5745]
MHSAAWTPTTIFRRGQQFPVSFQVLALSILAAHSSTSWRIGLILTHPRTLDPRTMANAADLLLGQITSLVIRCSSAITPLSSSDEEEET